MKFILLLLLIFSINSFAQDQTYEGNLGYVYLNSPFMYKMMEANQNLRKINIALEDKRKGSFENEGLIIGASIVSIFDYQVSSIDSKFGYLMRHPTANNQQGREVSEAVIHSFQLSAFGQVNHWISMYAELLYNPEQSFGAGTTTGLNRNQIQLRKGFVLLGNLNRTPFYFSMGKMDAPFGQPGSVSPFTNSTMWHAFGGLGYGAQLGFKTPSLNVVVMAVQGGAQFRALNTVVAGTNVPSVINNLVADVNYTINAKGKTNFRIGGSYEIGSAYGHSFPVGHFAPMEENNPAYAVYGKLKIDDRIILKGSYAKTVKIWPGTFNPTPPLNIYEASKVSSFDIGALYNFKQKKSIAYTLSAEFSNYTAGAAGSPWERQNQYILGFSGMMKQSSKLFVELFRTDGYVPLNFLSGGNLAPGETHSVRNAYSNGIVIGANITI